MADAKQTEPKAPKAPKVESVLVVTLEQAEALVKTLKENKEVVGSDIALREIDASIAKAEEITLAIQRGLLADK